MCLIMYKGKADAKFTNRQFKNMISRNNDGLGIMYVEGNRVKIDKCVGSDKEKFLMWKKYRELDSYAMHARLKTHGKIDLANCHPYKIQSIDDGDPRDFYMMHNGVLSGVPDNNKDMSDTWHFVEYIIKPIVKADPDLLWNSEEFQCWLMKSIAGSKLLFMRSDDEKYPVLILNHAAGVEKDGCWLSNAYSTQEVQTYQQQNYGTGFNRNPITPTQHTAANTMTGGIDNVTEVQYKEIKRKDNVLPFSRDPGDSFYSHLDYLQGLGANLVKEWVKDDPDLAADIILALYTPESKDDIMTYEEIIIRINDKTEIDNIVDIIRHIVSVETLPKAIIN